tara:strand:+ start:94 stop:699 length:606 start_codon:yes stop_codon:yes gene_type:complete
MTTSDLKWSVEELEVSSLKEYEFNPRIITPEKLKHLSESIKRFGVAEPLVVNRDLTIVGGHGRKKALTLAKIQRVDCYIPNRILNEAEVDELNIRLNKNIAGDFDMEMLSNRFNIEELEDFGFTPTDMGIDYREFDLSDDHYKGDDKLSIPQISYSLVFDNESQQKLWYKFLKDLKHEYSDMDTHSSRIDKFLKDNGIKED